jgi:hypothetical protein
MTIPDCRFSRAFLDGTDEVQFEPLGEDRKRYAFIAEVVRRLRYRRLKRCDKGVVMRYLERTIGDSRQQLTRLVGRVVRGEVLARRYTTPRKASRASSRFVMWRCSPNSMRCTARSRSRRSSA